jgi:hypothetical protein
MATAQQQPEIQPQEIMLRPTEFHLAMPRAPEIVLQEAAKAAQALREVIERKPNKCVINGKTFLQFEDWQTLGRFYGVTAAARTTAYIEQGRVRGYECHAEAIRADGQVISAAQAMCLDDEAKWQDKPLFQLRSMAQTRAQAKVLRNVLAWVVVMAGYAPTPAEEMDGNSRSVVPQHGPGLPAGQMEEMLGEIRRASTIDQLRKIYTYAYRKAQSTNDHRAMAAYIVAKDARKRDVQ